jgi:methionine-rich copper-binding protein CopC
LPNRFTLALATAASVSALTVATAFAHETVKSTSPGKGKTASTRTSSVTVTFNGQIRSGSIKVTGPGGKVVSSGRGGRDPRNVKRLRVPLKSGLKAGSYKATWSIAAADGHAEKGSFTFKLK